MVANDEDAVWVSIGGIESLELVATMVEAWDSTETEVDVDIEDDAVEFSVVVLATGVVEVASVVVANTLSDVVEIDSLVVDTEFDVSDVVAIVAVVVDISALGATTTVSVVGTVVEVSVVVDAVSSTVCA